jgi:hypothetical protein
MKYFIRGMFGGLFIGTVILGTLSLGISEYFRTFDWCPEHRWQVALLGAGIGGGIGSFIGILVGWTRLLRHHGLKRLASSEAAEFMEKASDRLAERTKTLLGKLGLASLRDVIKLVEEDRQTSLWIGDLSVDDMNENRQVERRTIAAFQHSGLSLPQFILQRRRMGLGLLKTMIDLQDIRFADYTRFSDTYHLSGCSRHLVTQLFDKSLLDHFSARDGCEIGGEGDWLIVAAPQRKHLSAASRILFSNQARELFSLFAAACRHVDTSAVPQETCSPTGLLDKLRPAVVSDSEATAFLKQPVPRSVPKKIARPHILPAYMLAIFGAFFLFASCISIMALFVAPITEALWLVGIPLMLGSVLFWVARWFRRKRLRLLSHGQVTSGFIQSVTRAILQSSTPRYRVQVQYEAMGTPTISVVTLSSDIIEEVWKAQEQNRQVPLMYDPHAPQHCLLAWQLSTSRHAHPSMRKPPDAPNAPDGSDGVGPKNSAHR